jgi:hypothetical protein
MDNRLAFCVFLAMAIVLFIGTIYFSLQWWNGVPPSPEGLPAEVTIQNALQSSQTTKSLSFDSVRTIKQLWRGDSARTRVQSDETDEEIGKAIVRALHFDFWEGRITTRTPGAETVHPKVEADIYVPPTMMHKWVKVIGELNISHPDLSERGGLTYVDKSKKLTHTTRLFVVTFNEFKYLRKRDEIEISGALAIICGICALFCAVACVVIKKELKNNNPLSPPNRKRPPDGARRPLRCRNWPTATTAALPPCAAPRAPPRFCIRCA